MPIGTDGSLRCQNCGKLILLSLQMIEGRLKYFCPRCHYFEEIKASTVRITKLNLTNIPNRVFIVNKTF